MAMYCWSTLADLLKEKLKLISQVHCCKFSTQRNSAHTKWGKIGDYIIKGYSGANLGYKNWLHYSVGEER